MNRKLMTVVTTMLLSPVVMADGEHKHAFANDVGAFHAVLSPLWHAKESAERRANTCKAAPELVRLAGAIRSADASALQQQAELLQKQCQRSADGIDSQFAALHDAFHALIGE